MFSLTFTSRRADDEVHIQNGTHDSDHCTVRGNNNVIKGSHNKVYGDNLKIIGCHNTVHGYNIVVYGTHNTIHGTNITLIGPYNKADGTNIIDKSGGSSGMGTGKVVGDNLCIVGSDGNVRVGQFTQRIVDGTGGNTYRAGGGPSFKVAGKHNLVKLDGEQLTLVFTSDVGGDVTVTHRSGRPKTRFHGPGKVMYNTATGDFIFGASDTTEADDDTEESTRSRKKQKKEKEPPTLPDPIANEEELPDSDTATKRCVMCTNRATCVVASPCGHFIGCVSCTRNWYTANPFNCTTCRKSIESFTRVFLPAAEE